VISVVVTQAEWHLLRARGSSFSLRAGVIAKPLLMMLRALPGASLWASRKQPLPGQGLLAILVYFV